MKLGEILAGQEGRGVFRAPTKRIKLKVLGANASGEQTVADAEAVLSFVPEHEREEARIEAERSLAKQYPGLVPEPVLHDARVYHLLQRALRDADDPRQPFAEGGVVQLKRALHQRTALDAYVAYERWCAQEFPEQVDEDVFEQLVEEAKKKSLVDLLSAHDSSRILEAMPSLVAHFGRSRTQTSGGGEPG